MIDYDRPIWPHDVSPPLTGDTLPLTYVAEMTAIGVQFRSGPDAVVAAIKDRLSPRQFAEQLGGVNGTNS